MIVLPADAHYVMRKAPNRMQSSTRIEKRNRLYYSILGILAVLGTRSQGGGRPFEPDTAQLPAASALASD